MNDAFNKQLILRHEGRWLKAYRDTRGNLTIGVGCNLDDPGAMALCQKVGISYSGVRAGGSITPAQCDALYELQYASIAEEAREIFPSIDSWPQNAAAVVCDMLFQLGYSGFLAFKNTIAAARIGDWKAMAVGIEDSELAREVPERVAQNIALLISIAGS